MKVDLTGWTRINGTEFTRPPTGKITCKICYIADFTGYVCSIGNKSYPSDMDDSIHLGFTIGNGKKMYWSMIWHQSGHVSVVDEAYSRKRWIDGGTEITIHWK